MSVKVELTMLYDEPEAARLITAMAPTPFAANEPAIAPVYILVLSATDEEVESLFAVILLR